jgi:opacity protein-like surface antigen
MFKQNKGNTMKNVLIAAAMLGLTAGVAQAADLGYGFSVETEVTAEYNATQDTDITLVATPTLAYNLDKFEFTVATDVDLTDVEFQGLDLELSYAAADNVSLYIKSSTDEHFHGEDVIVGGTIKF